MDKETTEVTIKSYLPGNYGFMAENQGYKILATFQTKEEMEEFIHKYNNDEFGPDEDEDFDEDDNLGYSMN